MAAAVAAVGLAAGCGGEVSSPDPSLTGEVGAENPENAVADPGFVCGEQSDSWVQLNGENFTPVPLGVLGEEGSEISWPNVELTRVADVNGEAVSEGMSVTIETTGKVVEGGGGSMETSEQAQTADGGMVDASTDAGTSDATIDATGDTGADTGAADSGMTDTAMADTGSVDSGSSDTGAGDTGAGDTGMADTGDNDTGSTDTGVADSGSGMEDAGGEDAAGDTGQSGEDAGEADAGDEKYLVWLDDTRLRFKISPDMNLEPGFYDVKVITARVPEAKEGSTEKTATRDQALGLLPRPTVDSVEKKPLCLEQSERTISLTGSSFLKKGETKPTVTIGEQDYQPDSIGGCTEPGGPFGSHELCTELTVTVPQGAYPPSSQQVQVTNFDPAACHSLPEEDDSSVRVVPAPEVFSAEPDPVCSAQTAYEPLRVTGRDFVKIGGEMTAMPSVMIGEYEPTEIALKECDAVSGNVPEGTERCSVIEATVDAGALPAGKHDVVVTNPGAADCKTNEKVALTSVQPPAIDTVGPQPVIGAQTTDRLTITGQRFAVIDQQMPTVTIGTGDEAREYMPSSIEKCSELKGPGQKRINLCSELEIEIPEGDFTLPDGMDQMDRAVQVTNPEPLGCASSTQVNLTVIDPPQLTGVNPKPICTNDGQRTVTVEGEDLLVVDGQTPMVGVGMNEYPTRQGTCDDSPMQMGDKQVGPSVLACESLEFDIPQDDLMEIPHRVTVYQPEPVGGFTATEDVDLNVVGSPKVADLEPKLTCLAEGSRSFTLTGQNFIVINPGMMGMTREPSLSVGQTSAGVQVDNVTDCGMPGAGNLPARAQRCNKIEFTLTDDGNVGPSDITVTNPMPAGCASQTATVQIAPQPTVTSAVPTTATCGKPNYRRVVVTGQKFLSRGKQLPSVTIGSTTYQSPGEVVAANNCSPVPNVNAPNLEYCQELVVYAPVADLSGSASVTVTNPSPSSCTNSNSVTYQPCP